ncbi:MAG: DUF2953 domain-containing protein [Lachnospiraceae bacterium]|nr:DUF2953 domain-containing protein [Lachnospiraceae bacterium]
MSIVLAILKWIGIVLGGILGLLLILVALFFLVPVRYHAVFESKDGKILYSFRFSWLLRLLSLRKKKTSDAIRLYVLGIPIRNLSEGKKDGKKKKEKPKSFGQIKEQEGEQAEEQAEEKVIEPQKEQKKVQKKEDGLRKKKSVFRNKKKKPKKKRFSFGKVSSIISIVREAESKVALRRLRGEIVRLIRYLSPNRIKGRFLIGTGDPASTGLLFGGISLLPFAYQKGIKISPDFDEKVFEADGYMKGRIRMLYLIRLIIRIYRDKELRMLWDNINQVNKKEAA